MLPTLFLLQWICRLVIWLGLGPWARLYYEFIAVTQSTPSELRNDQDRERDLMDKMKKIELKFQEKNHEARQKGEEALKLKSMRVLCFGRFIAKVPKLYTSRHYDYPLAESEGAHISFAREHQIPPSNFGSRRIVPSQQFEGVMIPRKVGEAASINDETIMPTSSEIDQLEKSKCCPDEMKVEPEQLRKDQTLANGDVFLDNDTGSLKEYLSFDDDSYADDYPKYSIIGTSGTKSRPSLKIVHSVGSGIGIDNDHEQYKQDSPMGCSIATLETSYTEVSSYLEDEEGIEIISTR